MSYKIMSPIIEVNQNNQLISSSDLEYINNEILDFTLKNIPNLISESSFALEIISHAKRVSIYAKTIGHIINLSKKEIISLNTAAFFHDIGKLCLPEKIFNKKNNLEYDEIRTMQSHSLSGHNLLIQSNTPLLNIAAIIALQHHEHWDGSGYPNGFKKDEIHLFARITTIADVFDALYSKRSYKPAWQLDKVIEYFLLEQGHCFDPYLSGIFLDNLDIIIESTSTTNLLQ